MTTDHVEERRRFISDAFHTLNQPLTGLHCGLEIALQKPRSEGEYRQRIGNGVEQATEIVGFIRAVRQLVDAADPGERFGTISLGTVLAQVKDELEVLAEATGVALDMDCGSEEQVKADPGKLVAALAGLIASEMEHCEHGGRLNVAVKPSREQIKLVLFGTATRPPADDGKAGKLAEIRRNAAISYLWTIGGALDSSPSESCIRLPLQKAQIA